MTAQEIEAASKANDALGSFLLSIVVVDDHAALSPEDDQEPASGGHGLNAKAIVDAFADLGMVCGVLKPMEGEDVIRRVAQAAYRADVVVLDWVLRADEEEEGSLACDIMRHLLTKDGAQHTLRFFVIYTGTPELVKISARCKLLLDSLDTPYETLTHDEFTLSRGPVTVSIFSKDTVEPPSEELAARVSSPGDLPAKLLADYHKRKPGMIASAALRAVAQVRLHTHRLLARFPNNVDAGYVWHRARLPHQEDAPTQVVEMIGAEIADLIDSPEVRNEVSEESVLHWAEARQSDLVRAGQFQQGVTVPFDDVRKVIKVGAKESGVTLAAFNNKGYKANLPIFAPNAEEMNASHEDLSMLMTLRKGYDYATPMLHSGIVVDLDGALFLCVQPLCDSVRLKDKKENTRAFPFLGMIRQRGDADRFNIVIPLDGGEHARCLIADSPYAMVMFEFPADEHAVQAKRNGTNWVFETADHRTLVYRATLRPMKSVSVVTALASELTRTGVDDPEWLRGWAGTNGS